MDGIANVFLGGCSWMEEKVEVVASNPATMTSSEAKGWGKEDGTVFIGRYNTGIPTRGSGDRLRGTGTGAD